MIALRPVLPIAAACLAIAALSGCSQVLGIEEAHVDPELDARTGAGGTSADSAGGSSASTSQMTSSLAEAGSASAEAGTSDSAETLCARYCAAVTASCTDTHAQYVDLAACLANCKFLPQGLPGEGGGNSVNCRLTYATKASSQPYTYCTWAGPGGDGKCGSNCDGFCTIAMQACTAASTGDAGAYFSSESQCKTTCAGLNDIGNYSAKDASQQRGADDVQCRLYHVSAAVADNDPSAHCPAAMGKSSCVNAAGK